MRTLHTFTDGFDLYCGGRESARLPNDDCSLVRTASCDYFRELAVNEHARFFSETLQSRDPVIASEIALELRRQQTQIELIASENIVSAAVMEAQGTVLTNKYAEGYPGKRYYGGCEHADRIEALAIDRVKALFEAEYANVQPHSGAQANGAVMLALVKPGDTVMGMSLDAGGHLTHGARPALSGK